MATLLYQFPTLGRGLLQDAKQVVERQGKHVELVDKIKQFTKDLQGMAANVDLAGWSSPSLYETFSTLNPIGDLARIGAFLDTELTQERALALRQRLPDDMTAFDDALSHAVHLTLAALVEIWAKVMLDQATAVDGHALQAIQEDIAKFSALPMVVQGLARQGPVSHDDGQAALLMSRWCTAWRTHLPRILAGSMEDISVSDFRDIALLPTWSSFAGFEASKSRRALQDWYDTQVQQKVGSTST